VTSYEPENGGNEGRDGVFAGPLLWGEFEGVVSARQRHATVGSRQDCAQDPREQS